MRTFLILLLLTSTAAADPDESLWDAEVRLGYGVAITTGDGMTVPRSAPLTLEGIVAVAVQDSPKLFGYGGFLVETLDRSSIGATAGVQLVQGPLRLRIGGDWIFAPYTLWGATTSGGICRKLSKGIKGCGDIALTEYFAGTDELKGHAETQVQLVFGMVFDGT